MLEETLKQLAAAVRDAQALSESQRQELLALVDELSAEIRALPEERHADAHQVAGFAEASARAAAQTGGESIADASQGFEHSLEAFEDSHPRLVHIANAIMSSLSNIGI